MAIKSSGQQLKFSEIEKEFGENPGRSLGRYKSSHPDFKNENPGELSNLPLDTGIPTGTNDQIKFSQFYSKRLNIVVDCHSSGSSNHGHDAYKDRYKNDKYVVVGGYRSNLKENKWQGGKKVIIHINNTFGSGGASDKDDFALTMGNGWPSQTTFSVDLGSSAVVAGRGGDGGSRPGKNGKNGSSALKLKSGQSYNAHANAIIVGGGGGGGGGADAEQNDCTLGFCDRNDAEGGGGGGGNGLPAGQGGGGNGGGSDGDLTSGGAGRAGEDDAEAEGGDGGNGGTGGDGEDASGGTNKRGPNGSGGEGGSAVLYF